MAEKDYFSYEEWKEYLKTDNDMNRRWKSLTSLWEKIGDELKNALDVSQRGEALRRRRELVALNVFNALNTTNHRLDFAWRRKKIWHEKDQRREYVIECLNAASDDTFSKIKDARWVVSMHWESIKKYLQPVADKIWALKMAKKVSVKTEVRPSKLSYESLKRKKTKKVTVKEADKSDWESVGVQASKRKNSQKDDGQLTIEFPEETEEPKVDPEPKQEVPSKTEEEKLEELYKFDPENEKYWNR